MSEAELISEIRAVSDSATLEAKLRDAEARLADLQGFLEQAPALICMLRGRDHVFSFANSAYQALFAGRTLVGKPVREAIPEAVEQGFIALLDGVYATGTPFHGAEVLLELAVAGTTESRQAYFDFIYKPYRDADGAIAGVLVHAVDASERVRQRERAQLFERLIDLAGWGVAEGSPDGTRLLTVNQAFAAMHGYTVAELTGADSGIVFAPEDRNRKQSEFVSVPNEQGFLRYESTHLRKDGTTFPCLTDVMAVKDADGGVQFRLGNFQDLTPVKRHEAQLSSLNDELAAQTEELLAQQTELQRLYEGERQHSATIELEVSVRTEELQAANEELQVQTEELEAHQDELRLAADHIQAQAQAVVQHRNFVERLIHNLPGAVAYWDKDLVYRLVNPLYAKLFNNKPVNDYVGKYMFDVFPGTEDQLEVMYRRVLVSGEPHRQLAFPFVFEDKGQTVTTYWDFELHAMRDPRGEVEGVLALAFEVSQRIQLEQDMATQRALTDRIIENAPAGIAYLDGDLVYRRLNNTYASLLDMRVEQILDKSIYEVFPGATDQFEPMMRGVMASGVSFATTNFPFKYMLDGTERITYWDFTFQPVLDAQGRTGILVLEVEVSDRVAKELLQLEQIDQLKQLDRYKDDFLSVISHELRTPLNFIMGFASTLDDEVQGPLNAQQHDALDKILNGSDRMLALVDDLLDFAKIQSGRVELSATAAQVEPLVLEVLSLLRPLSDKKGLTLSAQIELDQPVTLDGRRLSQVLTNLVGNAIKFTEAGGVAVRAFTRDGQLVLEVTDTGCGIAVADQHKLFNRFQQLDMSVTRKAGGTGLGLAIAKALVEAHGGEIGVKSAAGSGATFWLTLPLER